MTLQVLEKGGDSLRTCGVCGRSCCSSALSLVSPFLTSIILQAAETLSLKEKVWDSPGTVVLRGGGGEALACATLPSGDVPPSSLSPGLYFPHDPMDPVPSPSGKEHFFIRLAGSH